MELDKLILKIMWCTHFGRPYTKIKMILRRLSWPCARMTPKFMKSSILFLNYVEKCKNRQEYTLKKKTKRKDWL